MVMLLMAIMRRRLPTNRLSHLEGSGRAGSPGTGPDRKGQSLPLQPKVIAGVAHNLRLREQATLQDRIGFARAAPCTLSPERAKLERMRRR